MATGLVVTPAGATIEWYMGTCDLEMTANYGSGGALDMEALSFSTPVDGDCALLTQGDPEKPLTGTADLGGNVPDALGFLCAGGAATGTGSLVLGYDGRFITEENLLLAVSTAGGAVSIAFRKLAAGAALLVGEGIFVQNANVKDVCASKIQGPEVTSVTWTGTIVFVDPTVEL